MSMASVGVAKLEILERCTSGLLAQMSSIIQVAELHGGAGDSSVNAARLIASAEEIKRLSAELSCLIQELQFKATMSSVE